MKELLDVLERFTKKEITIEKAYRDQRDCINDILMQRKDENSAKYDEIIGKYGNVVNGFWVSARTDQDFIELINHEPLKHTETFLAIKQALANLCDKKVDVNTCYDTIILRYINLLQDSYNGYEAEYHDFCKTTNHIFHNAPIRMMEIEKIINILKNNKRN